VKSTMSPILNLQNFSKQTDKSTQDFENKIENVLRNLISKLNLATKDDIEALKKEVEELKTVDRFYICWLLGWQIFW